MENLITKGNRMPEISSLKIAVLSTVKQEGQASGLVGRREVDAGDPRSGDPGGG